MVNEIWRCDRLNFLKRTFKKKSRLWKCERFLTILHLELHLSAGDMGGYCIIFCCCRKVFALHQCSYCVAELVWLFLVVLFLEKAFTIYYEMFMRNVLYHYLTPNLSWSNEKNYSVSWLECLIHDHKIERSFPCSVSMMCPWVRHFISLYLANL